MQQEHQKILMALFVCIVLYYLFCRCFEKYDPFDPIFKPQQKLDETDKTIDVINNQIPETSNSGCDNDAMFVSSNLLPSNDTTSENYFEGLNVPVDVSDVELPLERQFYSTGACRNANLGIRSEPANPNKPVSPWLNSTIQSCDRERSTLDGLDC